MQLYISRFYVIFCLTKPWSGAPVGSLTSRAPRIAGSAGAVVTRYATAFYEA